MKKFDAMDDGIEFRFITRTLTQDYQVFCESGNKVLSDYEEFAPIREMVHIVPEDGPCAALFERKGKIFLVVSAMDRGRLDRAGRQMRFSFCRIYQNATQENKELSWVAFRNMVMKWDEAEREINREREQPILSISTKEVYDEWRKKNVSVEVISFNEAAFTKWLEDTSGPMGKSFRVHRGEERWSRQEFFFAQYFWPDDGYIFKWTKTDNIVVCQHRGDGQEEFYDEQPGMTEDRQSGTLLNDIGKLVKKTGKVAKGTLDGAVEGGYKGFRRSTHQPSIHKELQEVIEMLNDIEKRYQPQFQDDNDRVKVNIEGAINSLTEAIWLCNGARSII